MPLDADAGLTRSSQSSADITAVQPVARSRLLTRTELDRLGKQVTVYLGL